MAKPDEAPERCNRRNDHDPGRMCRVLPSRAPEQLGFGAGRGEGNADPCGGLGDATGNLEQAQAHCRELGGGQRLRFGDGVTDSQHQPVGGGVQHEAHLVGECRSTTGAVGGKLALVQLDQVLGLAAGAVESVS